MPAADFSARMLASPTTVSPTTVLRAEGAGALVLAVLAFGQLGVSWWLFALLFLVPDIAMLGYLAGPRLGAALYNAAHTYVLPLALGLAGLASAHPLAVAVAAIWVAHIGFDRLLGYGLKLPTGFGDTHLGRIGRARG